MMVDKPEIHCNTMYLSLSFLLLSKQQYFKYFIQSHQLAISWIAKFSPVRLAS